MILCCLGLGLIAPSSMLISEGVSHFGVTLPVLIGGAFLALAFQWRRISTWRAKGVWPRRIWAIGWLALCAWVLSVAAFFLHLNQLSTESKASVAPVALLVLGAGSPKCEVSPTLRSRLNVAYEASQLWPQSALVVSGGKDLMGRACTEAQVMRDALVAQGVSGERILLEGRSTSTAENFGFSKAVLERAGISASQTVAFVTNDFHGPRAMRIGQGVGFLRLEFLSAATPLRYRYHAWLREYFASLSSWILLEG